MNDLRPVKLSELIILREKPLIDAINKKYKIKMVVSAFIFIVASIIFILAYKNIIDMSTYVVCMAYLLIAIIIILRNEGSVS